MTEQEKFQNLLNNDKYQVFLFASPANLPFIFAIHPWLVINKKGAVSRFGVAYSKNIRPQESSGKLNDQAQWGHLYKNFLPPWQGIRIIPFFWHFLWKGRMLGYLEGDDGSLAERMADFIECSSERYPYKDGYALAGPNSNTYVQWVLNHFPEAGMRLPWNAFGKSRAPHVEPR